MKKITALILTLICLSIAVLPISAAAGTCNGDMYPSFEISDDFSTLILYGEEYLKFSSVPVDSGDRYNDSFDIVLTKEQEEKFTFISITSVIDMSVLYVDFGFVDGGLVSFPYIKDDYFPEYEAIASGAWSEGYIDFVWPDDNQVKITKSELFKSPAEEIEINTYELLEHNFVLSKLFDTEVNIYVGAFIEYCDKYYYIDFTENNSRVFNYEVYDGKTVTVHEVKGELRERVQKGIDRYYSEDLGFLENDELTTKISNVFLTVLFGIIPFVIFALFLIFAIFSKTYYRRFFTVISISALAELVIFIALAIMTK